MLVLKAKGRGQRIEVLAFSPVGDALLAAGNGSWLDVWRFDGSPPTRFFEDSHHRRSVFDARFLGDDAVVAACGSAGLRTQSLTPDVAVGQAPSSLHHLTALALSPDGRIIAISHSYPEEGYQCWTTNHGQFQPAWFSATPRRWPGGIAFMPDGHRFVSTVRTDALAGERETALVVRSAETGELQESHNCPYAFVHQLLFSPGGEHLLAHSGMGVAIWPAGELAQRPQKLLNDNRQHFTGIAFHPSGRFLAATSNDEAVKLYDAATWQLAKTFTWQVGRLRSVAFSPDGTLAAAGTERGQVVVWDVDE